jgi:ubiquinone biosynthesis monooxygenase Coq7
MPNYGLRPCRLIWIWAVAGFLLGIATPLLGRRALLTSIKAAEDTAHEHLGAQIHYLRSRDDRLAETIADVQAEEKKHVSISKCELGDAAISRYEALVYIIVYKLCQTTMWIVTRGASLQLKQFLALK